MEAVYGLVILNFLQLFYLVYLCHQVRKLSFEITRYLWKKQLEENKLRNIQVRT